MVERVARKFEVAIYSLTTSYSFTSSLWLANVEGRPLYLGVAIFAKGCGIICGFYSDLSPATGYQLPLLGGMK